MHILGIGVGERLEGKKKYRTKKKIVQDINDTLDSIGDGLNKLCENKIAQDLNQQEIKQQQAEDSSITIEEAIEQIWGKLGDIEAKFDKVMNRQDNMERNNVIRQETLGDSIKGCFYDVYGSLSGITMKQMDIKAYSKRIEEKLDRVLEGKEG